MIALVAAIWTIHVMRRQGASDDSRYQNQMARRAMAARAQMPDALSEMSDYSEAVGSFLTRQTQEMPAPPGDALSVLKLAIEHIEDSAAQRTFELVSHYQVHRARLPNGWRTMVESDLLYDVVLLQAYTNSLFDYARNEEPTVQLLGPSSEEMRTAFGSVFPATVSAREANMFEGLRVLIERRHRSEHQTPAREG